jgi:hypothetical protein
MRTLVLEGFGNFGARVSRPADDERLLRLSLVPVNRQGRQA